MSELIIKRNNINDSKEEFKIYQFLKDFTAKKCLFCFQDDEKLLCQCKVCGYYFCNKFHLKSSHIIIHLRQCKHSKISLYPFEFDLKCDECTNKNIFNLYFKDKKILCEDCLEEQNDFEKIVDNNNINSKILKSIGEKLGAILNKFDSYSESLFSKINDKIVELKRISLPIVSLNYTKKKRYCLLYSTLIQNEKDEIEIENMKDKSFDFELKFYKEENYILAEIKKTTQEFPFYPRQLLIVTKADNENKSFIARVIEIDKISYKIKICFKDLDKLLKDTHYLIKEKDSTASYDRILDGLDDFKQKDCNLFSKDIQLLIIGKEINAKKEEKEGKEKKEDYEKKVDIVKIGKKEKKDKEDREDREEFSNKNTYLAINEIPKNLDIKEFGNIKLNESQKKAINNCFKNKLTLIKGPPGTGKSTVLVVLAYHLLRLRKAVNDKILICAPSNRAVDNISFLLQKIKLNFVRVLSMEKEITEDVDLTNSLNDLIEAEIEKEIKINPKKKKTKELFEKRKKYGYLLGDDNRDYNKIIGEYQNKILNPCNIILSTINNSVDGRIAHLNFPIVIIDEATQALEPDCIMPLYHKAKMVIIIGDEKQLGPTVKSKDSNITGLSVSLFERLIYYYEGSSFISVLREQYRMHKILYEFSNKYFYNNQMLTKCEIKLDENVKNGFPWPKKDIPTFFYHYVEPEKKENFSFYNDKEIYLIYGIIHKLTRVGVSVENIGIITPYNSQKYRLYDKFDDEKYSNLRIESVDGFQGMEKEYIIISTVRSNISGNIGFLSSTKRLNVALTRAKKGVIILGNAECLAKKPGIWRDLIYFYFSKDLIVKGKLVGLEKVAKEEILNEENESESESEEEDIKNIEKEEKHKKVKKEIYLDFLKDIIKDEKKDTKLVNNYENLHIDNSSALKNEDNEDNEDNKDSEDNEDKEDNKIKNKRSKKMKNKKSNSISEEDKEKEDEDKKANNIKKKDSKYKEEDENKEGKKGKKKKYIQEDDKKRNNNKNNKKNQSSSSDEDKNNNKNKEKKKEKKKKGK